LEEKISVCFNPRQFVPAPAQGALAVQTRNDNVATTKFIAAIDDEEARMICLAERRVLTTMQCGCRAPVGAFAEIIADAIEICAFMSDLEGKTFIKRQIKGPAADADKLANKIANELLNAGGKQILENLEK